MNFDSPGHPIEEHVGNYQHKNGQREDQPVMRGWIHAGNGDWQNVGHNPTKVEQKEKITGQHGNNPEQGGDR